MEKGKTVFCAKIGIAIPLLIFKIQCTNSGGVFYFDELSSFYSKSEPYLCCHQSLKRGRLKVHLGS
jgi:hypothetical protein